MKQKIRKGRRRGLLKPVILGLAVLYPCIMLLATLLVRQKFVEEYDGMLSQILSNVHSAMEEQEAEPPEVWDEAAKKAWYQSLANRFLDGNEYAMASIAVYDSKGSLLARSGSTIGSARTPLDQLLSQEDKEAFAQYEAESGGDNLHPPRYEICARESGQIYEIFVYELTWKKEEDLKDGESSPHTYVTTPITDYFGNPVWEKEDALITWHETERRQVWKRTVTEPDEAFPPAIDRAYAFFPYMEMGGWKAWKAWEQSSFLQYFPEKIDTDEWGYSVSEVGSSSYWLKDRSLVRYSPDLTQAPASRRYLEVHMESSPWLAAMDYMKYVYVAGFAMMLVWMIKIVYTANRIYDQQRALEESRRDFVNAMAHEMKTPLGIIRNFAENLQDHNREEKRDYYLEQIVGQTEEMDRLVEEMILASKMDSENLSLQLEPLSMEALIRKQLSRLEPVLAEKNLQVEIKAHQDFLVEGDENYLSRALWNLLSNAAAYNQPEGMIRVWIDVSSCRIENTGKALSEEELSRAFELFYSPDKSRSQKGEKHLGMGLYLAKRILERHGLTIALENGGLGVRATITKDARR